MTEALATINTNSPLDIADAVLPHFDGNSEKKRKYLSYRLCGFGRNEACKYTSVHPRTINNWCQEDESFARIEKENLLELRKGFSKHIVLFEFTRNFRLTIDNDFELIEKVKVGGVDSLTKEEREYFIKARTMYTPQQFAVLEDLFTGKGEVKDFDWEMLVRGKGDFPSSTQKIFAE
jgi:hypothetical protein